MKAILFFSYIILLIVCSCQRTSESTDTPVTSENKKGEQKTQSAMADLSRFADFLDDTTSYQVPLKELFGKPISFYLNHTDVINEAKKLYNDPTKMGDNAASYEVLNQLISTKTEAIRPFYFHLCNYMVKNADGGLSQAIAPALQTIIEEHPKQFANYILTPTYNGRRQLFDEYLVHVHFEYQRMGNLTEQVDYLESTFSKKCTDCTEEERQLLDLVIARLKKKF